MTDPIDQEPLNKVSDDVLDNYLNEVFKQATERDRWAERVSVAIQEKNRRLIEKSLTISRYALGVAVLVAFTSLIYLFR